MKRSLRRIPAGASSESSWPALTMAWASRPRRVVVDAAVVSKWFMREAHSEAARRIVAGDYDVFVPDLIFTELGGILQRRVAADEIADVEALSILQVLERMPLQIHRTWPLGPIALELRRSLDRGIYDCIHIALALRETAVFVTADRTLVDDVSETLLSRHVAWIADIPMGLTIDTPPSSQTN